MQFVPWRYITDWKCTACGECCKFYSVVLNFHEWLKIVKNYGVEQTISGLDKLFIKRRNDGKCTFLYQLSNMHLCGLQHMKPKACKLCLLKFLANPSLDTVSYTHLRAHETGRNADHVCNGLRFGNPSWEFANRTLKEFIEIAMGVRSEQYKTTADMAFYQTYTPLRHFGVYQRV